MIAAASSSQGFVREQLRLLGLRLQREVNRMRAADGAGRPAALDEMLAASREPLWSPESPAGDLDREIVDLEAELRRRRETDSTLPISRLECLFGLSPAASDLVLMLLASA